jgi:hypothetical protein
MTLRTMVFPPSAASTDSIRASRVVDECRPAGIVTASAARPGRDNAEHGRPYKPFCIDSLGRISAGETSCSLSDAAASNNRHDE